jgi:predicted dehydrogenase/threonine dehydrogenase-like Zn-dependent dehydrogenase
MKQVMLSGKGGIEVYDVPVPALMANSVLVRNVYSLISTGTESVYVSTRGGLLGAVEKAMQSRERVQQIWNMAQSQGIMTTIDAVSRKLQEYVCPGYSCAGQVMEISSDDVPFRPGDSVACMGGGFATHSEYVVVPCNLVAKIPEGVDFDEASFGSLASIAIHGIRRLELTPGEQVGVIGLGLIGQITIQLLSSMGFSPVGIDLVSGRAMFAKEISKIDAWGIEDTDSIKQVLSITNGYGLDGVVVCASSKTDAPINFAFDLCRKGGRVSLVGDVGLTLSRAKMYQKEIELRVSCSYGPGRYDPNYEILGRDYPLHYVRWTEKRNLEYFLELLSKKRINIKPLITDKYPVIQAPEAYAKVKKGDQNTFGVLISYGDSSRKIAPLPREAFKVGSMDMIIPGVKKQMGTDNKKISLGIIGCGKFMTNVHIPNLNKLSKYFEIAAIASRVGASSTVVAKKYKIPVSTTDYRYLLDDQSINAVMVATRHSSHAKFVLEALDAGKHVFVEKPLCITVEDGRKIVTASREKGLIVRVGFNRRFSPYLNLMKQALGGAGVRMLFCRVNIGSIANDWSNTLEEGGRLLGEGVHFFDLCNWFIGQPLESVTSVICGDRRNTNPNVMIQIQYAGGCAAQILYTTLGNPLAGKEYFEAHGNGRTLVMDDYNSIKVFGCRDHSKRKYKGDKGHLSELEEFAAAIQGRPYPIAGADADAGLLATEMALSVYSYVKKYAGQEDGGL